MDKDTNLRSVHFIGVGGVGMSGIARVASDLGMSVSGSDMHASRYTDQLVEVGIPVSIGHTAENLPEDLDVVVISTAIPDTNPELVAARERGITVWKRAKMLAALGYGKKTLAAAGTHGKTTTSSMLATAIDALELSPTFVVGGIVDRYQTNAVSGTGEFYVVEADESDGSFLNLNPHIALVTNIEADHLDHYVGGIEEIYDTFAEFMGSVPEDGACVVCGDDEGCREVASRVNRTVYTYGFGDACDIRVSNYTTKGIASHALITFPDNQQVEFCLAKNPGRHNVLNATGVLGVVWAAGLDVVHAAEGLSQYSGVRRRFDLIGEADGVTVVDDYAHHPTEIKATTAAAAGLDFKRVVVLFQPHRYSRTHSLANQFGEAFDDASDLLVMDVYAAGEAPIEGVSGKLIADAVATHNPDLHVQYLPEKDEVLEAVVNHLQPGDLCITMGAGDVTTFAPRIVKALSERSER